MYSLLSGYILLVQPWRFDSAWLYSVRKCRPFSDWQRGCGCRPLLIGTQLKFGANRIPASRRHSRKGRCLAEAPRPVYSGSFVFIPATWPSNKSLIVPRFIFLSVDAQRIWRISLFHQDLNTPPSFHLPAVSMALEEDVTHAESSSDADSEPTGYQFIRTKSRTPSPRLRAAVVIDPQAKQVFFEKKKILNDGEKFTFRLPLHT